MFVIGTTKKLQKELSKIIQPLENSNVDPINMWIANLFKVSWYKGVVFMNLETRYCVILFKLRKKELNNIENLFKEQLRNNLKDDGVSEVAINQYLEASEKITYTNSFSRSILGSIKENIYFSEVLFAEELGIENPDMHYLNHYLNASMIHLPLGHHHPLELMKNRLETFVK